MASLRAFAVEAEAWRELADACIERAEALSDDANLAREAWLEAGRIYRENLGDSLGAHGLYRRAIESSPADPEAFLGIALTLHELDDATGLIALYSEQLERTEDRGRHSTLRQYLSEVHEEKLSDPDRAMDELLRATGIVPNALRLLPRLVGLAEKTGRHLDLAIAIGEAVLECEDPKLRAALCYELAQLHLGPLADRDRALTHLRAALQEWGEDGMSLPDVESSATFRVHFDAMADLLAAHSEDRRSGPHRIRLERELAKHYEEEMADNHRALMAVTRALALAPEDRDLQDEVLRLGLMSKDLQLAANTFEHALADSEHPLVRTFLRLRLGHLYSQALDRPEEAVRVYEQILEDDPRHQEASRRLEALYDALGAEERLLEFLERVIQRGAADDTSRVRARIDELHGRLGTGSLFAPPPPPPTDLEPDHGFEAKLDDPDPEVRIVAARAEVRRLIDELRDLTRGSSIADRVLRETREDDELLSLLEETYRRRDDWQSVCAVLERRIAACTEPEFRRALHLSLASVLDVQLDDKQAAIDVLRREDRDGPFDLELSLVLERLLTERMAWSEVDAALHRRVELSSDAQVRARARLALARLAMNVQFRPDAARDHLHEALREAENDVDVIRLAAEVAGARGDGAESVQLYERLARDLDGQAAAEAWVMAGVLARDELMDEARAEAAFESALACDAANRDAALALFEMAQHRSDWSIALLWGMRAADLSVGADAMEILRETARIADEELGDEPKALQIHRAVLRADPMAVASEARIAGLIEDRDPRQAFTHYVHAAQFSAEAEASVRWYSKAAELAQRIGDEEGALTAYRAILARDYAHRAALLGTAEILERRETFADLYELGAAFLLHHEANATRIELADTFRRMARSKEHHGEWEAAARFGERELELSSSMAALDRLARYCIRAGRTAQAAALCQRLARQEVPTDVRATLLSEAGRLYGELAGDPHRAAVALEEALAAAPNRGDLSYRLAVYRYRTHDLWAAAQAFRKLASHCEGPSRASALRIAASWLWEHHRGEARALLEESLEAEPSLEATKDLSALLEYDGDHDVSARPWLALAKFNRGRGRLSEARLAFRRAAERAAFRSHDDETLEAALQGLRELDPDPRWWVLRAHRLDAQGDPSALDAWIDVSDRIPGHRTAVQRIHHLSRPHRAMSRFLDSVLQDQDVGLPTDIEYRESFRPPGGASPDMKLMDRLGPGLVASHRPGGMNGEPRRRDRLGEAEVPIQALRALRSGFRRLGREIPPLFATTEGPAMRPVLVDGGAGLGIRLDRIGVVASEDVMVGAGIMSVLLEPGSAAIWCLPPLVLHETIVGLSERESDHRSARRRARQFLKALSPEGREQVATWFAEGGRIHLPTVRERVRLRALRGGLCASLWWHGTLRNAVQWTGRPADVRVQADLLAFVTGGPFLRWLRGVSVKSPVVVEDLEVPEPSRVHAIEEAPPRAPQTKDA